jgi:hypothetical protein
MTQRDLKLEKTSQKADGKPEEDNEIEVLEGKGSTAEIKAKERAKAPDRNNLPGVELS